MLRSLLAFTSTAHIMHSLRAPAQPRASLRPGVRRRPCAWPRSAAADRPLGARDRIRIPERRSVSDRRANAASEPGLPRQAGRAWRWTRSPGGVRLPKADDQKFGLAV